MTDYLKDPAVTDALKERPAYDVCLILCPQCGLYSYYNQGSHAGCFHCGKDLTRFLDDDSFADNICTVQDMIDYDLSGYAELETYNEK
jgi:hypothetical protein